MFRRFCCKELKERYISDYLFVGVRRAESEKRSSRYTCFEDTFVYSKKVSTSRFMPLLFFSDDDISWVIEKNSLEMHPLYYDECGKFCVDRRLGCIGCPLQGDRGRGDFKVYPKLLMLVIERAVTFHLNHGRSRYDAYLNAVYNLFYSNHGFEKYVQAYQGLFETDPKETLEKYFSIKLPNY
jgi:3'-phosphoadenosine 5'-phosphosulfate sulfotransferase (PAPS reductase)/FAD synthetase